MIAVKNNTFIYPATEMSEGDGVDVNRLFPVSIKMMNYDPFVLWDNFSLGPDRGFPRHPHRGFEAITYMFSGSLEHKDNLGNASRVGAGGAQRFTAGRGLEHSEMPDSNVTSIGIQLWINLSKKLKSIEPDYQQVDKEDIPVIEHNGAKISVIVGNESPLKLNTEVRYLDVRLDQGASLKESVAEDFRGFIYIVSGELEINAEKVSQREAYFYEGIPQVDIKALQQSHFMLCMGKPHGEPIKQHGPYVD